MSKFLLNLFLFCPQYELRELNGGRVGYHRKVGSDDGARVTMIFAPLSAPTFRRYSEAGRGEFLMIFLF